VMGLPFAGKRKFVNMLDNYLVIDTQALNAEVFSGKAQDRRILKIVSFMIQSIFIFNKEVNVSVLGIFHRKSQRKKMLSIFSRFNLKPDLVHIHRNSKECLEDRARYKGIISENKMLNIINSFQTPTSDEGFKTISVVS